MRIGFIPGVLGVLCTALSAHAQESDLVRNVALPEVVVAETYQQLQNKKTALTLEVADRDFLRKHFTGNFMRRWRIFRACKLWISVQDFPNR